MEKSRLLPFFIIIPLLLGLVSPGIIHIHTWLNGALVQQDIQDILKTSTKSVIQQPKWTPADGDCLQYSNQRLELVRCEETGDAGIWQSPEDWMVEEFLVADLNRDGTQEYALLVWRPFEPWPIDRFLPNGGRIAEFHNKAGLSAHLILVGWDGDEYRELWAGSSLANPISAIRTIDIDRDGYEELIALEGEYDSAVEIGNITIWQWQGFGFTLLNRMEGKYSGYAVFSTNQQISILTY
jgi:hypothetical protein